MQPNKKLLLAVGRLDPQKGFADLVQAFTELANRRGDTGLLTFLASFFKSPLGVSENDFIRQFQMLEAWADEQEETVSATDD